MTQIDREIVKVALSGRRSDLDRDAIALIEAGEQAEAENARLNIRIKELERILGLISVLTKL